MKLHSLCQSTVTEAATSLNHNYFQILDAKWLWYIVCFYDGKIYKSVCKNGRWHVSVGLNPVMLTLKCNHIHWPIFPLRLRYLNTYSTSWFDHSIHLSTDMTHFSQHHVTFLSLATTRPSILSELTLQNQSVTWPPGTRRTPRTHGSLIDNTAQHLFSLPKSLSPLSYSAAVPTCCPLFEEGT